MSYPTRYQQWLKQTKIRRSFAHRSYHGPFPSHLHSSSPVTSLEQSQNQIWTPLETLAEVSRQIEANEKHDDHVPTTQDPTAEAVQTTLAAAVVPITATANSFELHEQFTLENPPTNLDSHSHRDIKGMASSRVIAIKMYVDK